MTAPACPEAQARAAERLRWPLIVGVTFVLLALAIVGPLYNATAGPHDDHEIPVISQALRDGGPVFAAAGYLAERRGRFRPAYWVLRVAETALWGENITGWYLDRFALLLGALAAGYALARLWFRPAVALLAAALIVSGSQAEAFGRLGPQEAYAVPLALLGLALIGRRRFGLGLALLAVTAFTKESFVPFCALGVAWAWYLGARQSALAAGAAVALAFAGGLYRVTVDGALLGQERTPTTIITTFGALLLLLARGTGWPLVLWSRYRRPVLLIGAAIVLPQVIVLAGLDLHGRYLFPAVFAGILAAAAAADRSRLAYVLVAVLLVANVGFQAYVSVKRSAATRAWTAIVTELRTSGLPIVVRTSGRGQLEPAVALRRALPAAQVALDPWFDLSTFPAYDPLRFERYAGGPCIELLIDAAPSGNCERVVVYSEPSAPD